MTLIGKFPLPTHTIAHISDTHFLSGGRHLYDAVDTEANLLRALEQLERSDIHPQALVFTGDLADLGEPDAYLSLRAMVEPVAARMGAEVIWVMGNHDERMQYSHLLFDVEATEAPQDRVYDIAGLRIVSLDTTVPGFHHGALDDGQLEWLRDVLATPAPNGTLVALHHPPMPNPLLWVMDVLELHGQDRLAEVIRGTDVRAILGGHLHHASHSTFAGVPVSVAAATCYTLDLSARDRLISGVDSGQSMTIVSVYDDRLVHSLVPIGPTAEVSSLAGDYRARIEAMSFDARIDAFSRKTSTFNTESFDPHRDE